MLPENILEMVAAGDNMALRMFYEHYKARVYNTCLSYLQNVEEAEEVTQDVFVEVFQSASRFLGRSSVATWVYRISVNKCVDRIRYKGRQKRFAFISSIFGQTGEVIHDQHVFEHPGVKLENKERSKMVFAAIKQLPENQQTAFILRQIEGLSQREIAEIMDMTEKAVESLLQRAKANLRKILENFYNDNEGNKS